MSRQDIEHIERVAQLSQREFRFCVEYLKDANATQAAMRAGYSSNGAGTQGHRLLQRPEIKAEIEHRKGLIAAEVTDKYAVTREKLIRELALIAYGNVGDFLSFDDQGTPFFDFSEATRDQLANLDSIVIDEYSEGRGDDRREVKSIKIKQRDKLKAIAMLAEMCNLMPPKQHEISGPGGGPIPVAHAHVIMARDLTPEQRDDLEKVLLSIDSKDSEAS